MKKIILKKLKIKEKFIPKKYFSSFYKFKNNTICFSKKIDQNNIKKINNLNSGVIILNKKNKLIKKKILQIIHPIPKFYFFKLLNDNIKMSPNIYIKPKIRKSAVIDKSVIIGSNCSIGDNTKICANVVIGDNVRIGKNCYIKSNTVIGQRGFGNFVSKGKIFSITHIGGVKIGNDVEIGALNTIAQATLDYTIVKSNNKFDDHVHVAHNCIIHESNEFTAGVILGGSTKIGKNNFFGLNTSVKNRIKIGNNNFIGSSSNITKNISNNKLIYGNPAKVIKKN
jgi:UDP-3-O-[3-hydroxymyristoyl] glucosamine N-acyltransferase LpxD